MLSFATEVAMFHFNRSLCLAAGVIGVGACATASPPPAKSSCATQDSSSSSAATSPPGWGGGLPVGGSIATFHASMSELARSNEAFRRVLFTGSHTQLVAMSLRIGEDIGVEKHKAVEQIFIIVEGNARISLDAEVTDAVAGDVVVVPPGVHHDVRNAGPVPLKLLTIYSPPAHLAGRVHETKAAAEADAEDQAFGDAVE